MTVSRLTPRSLAAGRAAILLAALLGILGIVAGLLVLRVDSSTPLLWGALQDTIQAVFPNPQNIVRGAVLIVLGGILYGWSVRGAVLFPPWRDDGARPAIAPSRRADVPLVIGLGLYAATIILMLRGSTGYLAGGLLLGALIALSFAVARRFPRGDPLFTRTELALLSLAALAACVLYLHDAGSWFFSWVGDEYAFFDLGRVVALHSVPLNIFSQAGVYGTHPVMDSVYQGAVMRVLGVNVFGWRASAALATALPVFPVYLLGRTLCSRLVGALTVGLYLPSHVLMAYAHIGYNEPDALFPLTAAIALLAAGRLRRAPFYLFLSGVFSGVGWYTLSTARLAIGLVLLGAMIYRPGSLREAARSIGLIAGGFALVLLPFVLANGAATVTIMADQSRLGFPGLPPLGVRLSQNGLRSLFAFVYSTDIDNHYVTGALFDTVSAVFLLLGLAALFTWEHASSTFLLLCYWLLIAVNGPTYYTLHLNTTRMYIVVPLASVIAAIGAASLIAQVRSLLPDSIRSPALPAVATAGIIVLVIALNLYLFYGQTPQVMPSTPQALAMKVIQEHPGAALVEAQELAKPIVLSSLEAYGVQDRVLLATDGLPAALRRARSLGRPILILTQFPLRDPLIKGKQTFVWDPGHHMSIVESLPGG